MAKKNTFDLKLSKNGARMICESTERTYKLDPRWAEKLMRYSQEFNDVFQRVADQILDGNTDVTAGELKELIYNLRHYDGESPKAASILANKLEKVRFADPSELNTPATVPGEEATPEAEAPKTELNPIQKLQQKVEVQPQVATQSAPKPVAKAAPAPKAPASTATPSARPAPAPTPTVSKPAPSPMMESKKAQDLVDKITKAIKETLSAHEMGETKEEEEAEHKETESAEKDPKEPMEESRKPVGKKKINKTAIKEEAEQKKTAIDASESDEYKDAEKENEEEECKGDGKFTTPQSYTPSMKEAFLRNRVKAILSNKPLMDHLLSELKVERFIAAHESKNNTKLDESQKTNYYNKVVNDFVNKTVGRFNNIDAQVVRYLMENEELEPENLFDQPGKVQPGEMTYWVWILVPVQGEKGMGWSAKKLSGDQGSNKARALELAYNARQRLKGNIVVGLTQEGWYAQSPKDLIEVVGGEKQLNPEDVSMEDAPMAPSPIQEAFNRCVVKDSNAYFLSEYITILEYAANMGQEEKVVLEENEVKVFTRNFLRESKFKMTQQALRRLHAQGEFFRGARK